MESFKRLDLQLLQSGLASTRTKAQELICSGKVSVDGKIVCKPGEKISSSSLLLVSESEHPYVSRGGVKLAAALDFFKINPHGLRVLDIGQSTGGFTQCLLFRGAASVVGVDVGFGQLSALIRQDSRVSFFEKQDIRTLQPERVTPAFSFFVVDLSFISLTHILPVLPRLLAADARGIVLVKPQFEVGSDRIGSGGIVRDAAARDSALALIRECSNAHGFTVAGEVPSPIAGGDGNLEFFLYLERASSEAVI